MLHSFIVNSIVVASCVLIHYEILYRLANSLPHFAIRPRYRILIGVFTILVAHVIEIWIFALAYFLMIHTNGMGSLTGNFDQSLTACSYFSFTSYTTLGFGDIEPSGHIRFLTGFESLTGLVLITWSASFLFLEMQKYWGKK